MADMPTAIVTGASAGFGRALADALAGRGWNLVIDARRPGPLREAAAAIKAGTAAGTAAADGTAGTRVTAIAGDIADPGHRAALVAAAREYGGLDLVVNNASVLGPSPLPPLAVFPVNELPDLFRINVFAPLALIQLALPLLTATGGTVVNVSSDAAVEPYEGWGGYGSSKAALDQLTAVLAAEQGGAVRVYAFDPGDMRTAMHQLAFPGEDISDRPEPETVVPALLRLVDERPAGDRYRASDLAAAVPS
jgi:NAD(P)-dependent dehydrogenase (short-subunit alcohol dehydrogenase family)